MKEYIEWKQNYSVNNDEIDSHHRKIIQLINALYESDNEQTIHVVVEELKQYLDYHFKAEDRIMEEYKYPQIEYHRLEHEGFASQVTKMSNYEAESKLKSGMIVNFLNYWLIKHILDSDKTLFKYIDKLENKHGD